MCLLHARSRMHEINSLCSATFDIIQIELDSLSWNVNRNANLCESCARLIRVFGSIGPVEPCYNRMQTKL